MNITHFKNLPSHKYPVLQLYRRIIRHIRNCPLPDKTCLDLQNHASLLFKQNKNMMSGHIAKNMILDGYKWEERLRNFILNPLEESKNSIINDLSNHKLNQQTIKPVKQEKNISTLKLPMKLLRLNEYNQSGLLESGSNSQTPTKSNPNTNHSFESFRKSHTKLMTRRDKTIKRLSPSLPSRNQLDPLYIDLFLSPQFYNNRYNFQMERRKVRETSQPGQARISTIATPRGPYSYLKVPGRYSNHRISRSNHILRLLKDKQMEKLKDIQFMISIAKSEAKWEYELSNGTIDLETFTKQWTGPLLAYQNQLQITREKQKASLLNYRKVLITHKHLLDEVMKKNHQRAIIKWNNYTPRILHTGRLYKRSSLNQLCI